MLFVSATTVLWLAIWNGQWNAILAVSTGEIHCGSQSSVIEHIEMGLEFIGLG
jgi:putative sterol carrier protein